MKKSVVKKPAKKKVAVKKPAAKKAAKFLVTKKWLLDLADKIYDPKTRKFTPLCAGSLSKYGSVFFPDMPKGYSKPVMHCGLGELYFAMTGTHPNPRCVLEGDIINKVVENSTINCFNEDPIVDAIQKAEMRKLKNVIDVVKKQKFSYGNDEDLLVHLSIVSNNIKNNCTSKNLFRKLLLDIPTINDKFDGKARSQAVAAQLRSAAAFLPK